MSIISTKRTIIRRPQPTDIEGIIALGSDSIIQSFNCFSTPTREKVQEYLQNTDKHPNRYVIALAQSDSYIGEINFETDSLRYGVNATMQFGLIISIRILVASLLNIMEKFTLTMVCLFL